jgi:anti-sigma-K factor RskA
MSHDKEKYQDELTLFSLDLLEGDEKKRIEEHLKTGCEVCLRLLKENELVVSSLAYSLDDSPIDPGVEAQIFDKIDAGEFTPVRTPKSSFWSNIRPIWLNLGSAVAVGLLIFLFMNNMSLRNELFIQKQDMADLRASLKEDSGMMDFFTDPDVQTVELASAMTNIDSTAKLMWNVGNSDALLLVSNMPALKAGMEYQVWCMEDGKPVSVGTFTVNKDGKSMMEIDFMPKPSKDMQVLVTLEPEGGMPEPTGATYLVGSL